MRQIVYWPNAKRLVYLEGKATPQFWDHRWQAEGKPGPANLKDEVVTVTEKYLPRGARILEGGCGRANKVMALSAAGYRATGVDFAEDSVKQARLHYPDLDIRQGDVRSLDFPDGHFDGYWSMGVIEHFWEGYGPILAEAARVLRPNGYLFGQSPGSLRIACEKWATANTRSWSFRVSLSRSINSRWAARKWPPRSHDTGLNSCAGKALPRRSP